MAALRGDGEGLTTIWNRRVTLASLILAACSGAMACAPAASTIAFSPPPEGPAVPLPAARPSNDKTLLLPTSKDEVPLELHPRVEQRESVAADSNEQSALLAAVVLTLPANRGALRRVDVSLTVKRRPDGAAVQTKDVTYSRDTREEKLTVPLDHLGKGAYDVEVRTRAQIDVLDDDWTVMVDTKEATERADLVIGAAAGKTEQTKLFEFHFDNDATAPIEAEQKALARSIQDIGALFAAREDATARVDCWTSSSGEEAQNMALAFRRCEWFKAEVWSQLSHKPKQPLAAVAHGSNELAASERGNDPKVQSRNRVVRLRVRWVE